ncbi:MAG: shikimate dehydrogenase [Bacillota bacterium]|nr:shikimate dehydrogenase [Bacillota bacterium]
MNSNYGLIGEKLGHSISPIIHKYIFEYYGIKDSYKLYEVERDKLGCFIKECKADAVKGLNVTIPYKIDVLGYLDEISEEAEKIGAVNTLLFNGGRLSGYNTDYYGIQLTFKRHNVNVQGKEVVVLGSGGASTAVLQYLKDSNCGKITMIVRNKEKVLNNSRFSGNQILNYNELNLLGKRDILINCTPLGMYPDIDNCPVPHDFLQGFNFIFDLIYNPLKTKLLKYSGEYGISNCNGLYMLIGQAIFAESIWNNIEVDEALVEKIFLKLSE